MNNKELISALAKATDKKNVEANTWMKAFTSVLSNTLSNGGTVSIQGFGVFEVKKREERVSVNPLTGKRFLVPPKLTPVFKPVASLKTIIKNISIEA